MRIRSTGLGDTELICEGDGAYRKGDYLILSVQTTSPVMWHVRIGIDGKDMLKIGWMMAKRPFSLLFALIMGFKKNKQLPDY